MTSKRTRETVLRNALSGVLAVALLGGCSGAGYLVAAGVQSSEAEASTSGKTDKAIARAEKNVARNPRDAALRSALAEAYFRAGRLESAATAYADAMELGDRNPRTALSLALAHIGSGDNRRAVALLDEWRDSIPAGDLGLALALAGQTNRGVSILSEQLRAGDASAKLRQNLAYAYALDGRWSEARLMAAQDVPADKLDDRIATWAKSGKPEDYQVRVAALLGVPVARDSGQPEYLALGGKPADAPAVAATSYDSPRYAPANGGELPALGEGPQQFAAAPAPAREPAPADFEAAFAAPQGIEPGGVKFVSNPVVQAIPSRRAPARTSASAVATPVQRAVARLSDAVEPAYSASASGVSTHVVQLGSFSSEDRARRAWGIFVSRNPALKDHDMQITPAIVRGRKYWRVAAVGFDRGSARSMCSRVKGRGGGCLAYAASVGLPGALPGATINGPMKARR